MSVLVRSVGGGEPWDRFIDRTPGGSNDSIGGILGNIGPGRQARAGRDYQQVNTTLLFLVCGAYTVKPALKTTWL